MKGDSTKKNFATLLGTARLPERSVQVCLRGDLVADHEAAERDLEQAQKRSGGSLAGGGIGAIVERIEALEAQMQESTYAFRLRAMPKPKFRALIAAHGPRRGDDGEVLDADRHLGVNAETFFDALIRACLVDPELDDAEWLQLVEALTDAQYDELSGAAWLLNRSEVDIPFSRAASRAKRLSADE